MGVIYEKIEIAISRMDTSIDTLTDYEGELTENNLNEMASLANKLQQLVFRSVLSRSKGGES